MKRLTVRLASLLTAVLLCIYAAVPACADEAKDICSGITAKSSAVIEVNTGTFLSQSNADEKQSVSHLAKLMTVLLAAERIDEKRLFLEDTVIASAHANSMNGTQIWLDVGEAITVEELLKAITIGNANDACVALAEKIGGSEESFVELMNSKAKSLNMSNTHYADCTGISLDTVSTAHDTAILCMQLAKYDFLKGFFTTWMDTVRNGKTELVSTNRLIRTYSGALGLKACSSEQSGECIAALAQWGDMKVCCVLLGCKSDDDRFSDAKTVLDNAFSAYEIYTPELDEEMLEDIRVEGGERQTVGVKTAGLHDIVIEKGTYKQIECEWEREESVEAPFDEGTAVGTVIYKISGNVILQGNIAAEKSVKKIKLGFALKKALLILLKI